jgi:hypothetical protein
MAVTAVDSLLCALGFRPIWLGIRQQIAAPFVQIGRHEVSGRGELKHVDMASGSALGSLEFSTFHLNARRTTAVFNAVSDTSSRGTYSIRLRLTARAKFGVIRNCA